MNSQDTKQDPKEVKEELTWNKICNQVGKERFDPYYTNAYGVNLAESKYRRKKEDAKT